jgi:GH15 family glucan-1,4-alpha-glucosidase
LSGEEFVAYLPIENYGVIGDLFTIALVGMNGSIDWYCSPNFDSPSVFAAILDDEKGGYFQIRPADSGRTAKQKQFYWPDTNILITRFLSPDGVGSILDFMPVSGIHSHGVIHDLIRVVQVVRGSMRFRMECRPAFNYARDKHDTVMQTGGACFFSQNLSLGLATNVPITKDGNGVVAEFELNADQTATFYLREIKKGAHCGPAPSEKESGEILRESIDFWHRWVSQCTYAGRWREMVLRSALALKLMQFQPTGAMVASPTTSLPEWISGPRNWDYRFTWIRDAAFTLYGLMRIGFTQEADAFIQWIHARCHELGPDGSLQPLYALDGRHKLNEEILSHLKGYQGSHPVRIGNNAYQQSQLDIAGELMDSVYLYNKYGQPISYDLWTELRRILDWVCANWNRKDDGIWEVRSGAQHFTFSRMMCWVALDRGLRLADKRSFPADRAKWYEVRDQIYEDIIRNGWSANRKSFVQHYGGTSLDASLLLMPLVFFMAPRDPRMLATLQAIRNPPSKGGLVSDSLVYRYNVEESPDGIAGIEGTFNMCSFWLVEALTRAGMLNEARLMFERMLGYSNHVGLYSEQTGLSGEALGNFPQAFTHLALISAAYNLDRRLGSPETGTNQE